MIQERSKCGRESIWRSRWKYVREEL